MGQPFALDYGAVFAMGGAMGADMALLADVLPAVERAILTADDPDTDEEEN